MIFNFYGNHQFGQLTSKLRGVGGWVTLFTTGKDNEIVLRGSSLDLAYLGKMMTERSQYYLFVKWFIFGGLASRPAAKPSTHYYEPLKSRHW